jgi:dTDP-4-amino-4,6-dideoxygalactose transaminase
MKFTPRIRRYEPFHWGEFIPFLPQKQPDFLKEVFWFAYSRQALKYGLDILGIPKKSKILVPDYICNTVEPGIVAAGMEITYYNITENLTPDFEDAQKKIDKYTKAFLAVNYWGLPAPFKEIREFCKENRLYFIEDNAQGLINREDSTPLGRFGDISITSLYKWIPIMHGAVLYVAEPFRKKAKFPNYERFPIKKSLFKYIFYYVYKYLFNLESPEELKWENVDCPCPDPYMRVRLNPYVPKLVRFINFDKLKRNRNRKFRFILRFLKEQDMIKGKIFLNEQELRENIPFQVPFLIKEDRDRTEILRFLNSNGIEAFYWPNLPKTVYSDPDAYPVANYFMKNLLHFQV